MAQQNETKSNWLSGWFGPRKMTTTSTPISSKSLLKGAAGGDYGVRQLFPGETEYENAKEQFLVGAISLRPQPRIMKIFSVQTNQDVVRSFEVAQRVVGNERSLFHGTSQQPHCNFAREGDLPLSTHRIHIHLLPRTHKHNPNDMLIQRYCNNDTKKYTYNIQSFNHYDGVSSPIHIVVYISNYVYLLSVPCGYCEHRFRE